MEKDGAWNPMVKTPTTVFILHTFFIQGQHTARETQWVTRPLPFLFCMICFTFCICYLYWVKFSAHYMFHDRIKLFTYCVYLITGSLIARRIGVAWTLPPPKVRSICRPARCPWLFQTPAVRPRRPNRRRPRSSRQRSHGRHFACCPADSASC